MSNRPVHEVRIGRIRASVWSNPGDRGPRYSVQFSRLYKDEEDQWADSTSFNRDDLLLLAKVVDRVHSWVCDQADADKPAGEG